ncbi:MAG: flagellar motor switch protein FliM [Clostridiales bacterium]|nr:flagellar motor switch protein FliM [Clostridiales bacterium]
MADVLSQSQIDALLNAVQSGEKDLEQPAEENEEKKYHKYDFYSPKKFTKDRIKMLSSIFENYTRVINSRLNATLRTNCEVEVESIEEQRYYEFSNALTDGDVLSLASVVYDGKDGEEPVLFYLNTSAAMSMMDRMMGGEGVMDDNTPSDYTYTDLELHLYENIMMDLVSVLGNSWESYIPMTFSYTRTEVNPTLVQLIGIDEIVVIVDLKLQFSNFSGRMSICLPAMMLTNIFAQISNEGVSKKDVDQETADEILDQLKESSLEITAELGKTDLSLSDIYHLNVGDVIDLGRQKEMPIYLNIGGYCWFTGYMGVHKKNMAVKIEDVCYQAERRSE